MLEVSLALVAALLFALGTVLQQKEAQEVSDEDAKKAGFLLRLARRPVWLAGMAADGVGYAAQAAALGIGRIVVVQPLLATTVVFALPFGARILGQPIRRRRGAGGDRRHRRPGRVPRRRRSPGRARGRDDRGVDRLVRCRGRGCVPLVIAGRRASTPAMKATLLGIATGILWGLSAGLTKAVVEDLDEGVLSLLGDWHLYALAVVGWASLTLAQASLQAGALAPAVATQAAVDPIASVLLGTLAFEETIHHGALGVAGSLAGFAAMVAGIVVLASSQGGQTPSAQPTQGVRPL